ncbi:MAG: DUF2461 family protein [Lysobacter sp.]
MAERADQLALASARVALLRIYRDARFSHGKSPCKNWQGGYVAALATTAYDPRGLHRTGSRVDRLPEIAAEDQRDRARPAFGEAAASEVKAQIMEEASGRDFPPQ